MKMKEIAALSKKDSYLMGTLPIEVRNQALLSLADALEKNKEKIFLANKIDMEKAKEANLPLPLINRLKFDEKKLLDCVSGIRDLVKLDDPLFNISLDNDIREGLRLVRESCPIGVIGIIFESRPDALIQIASLCIKSGNCLILKGGSEAIESNKALFNIVKSSGISEGLPSNFSYLVENREEIDELLKCHEYIDLIIPRGSNEFVKYIMDNSKIPVLGHADGICHIFVDETANLEKAINIIINAKTQYPSACNALETLLVHEKIAPQLLPQLYNSSEGNIKFIVNKSIANTFLIPPSSCNCTCKKTDHLSNDCTRHHNIIIDEDINFSTEYSDCIMSIKLVSDIEDAINHINNYGSHHTDCIITEDIESVNKFMSHVDSAGVYHNASTRFADGFRYGFGAEVGISTGKIHARGPVGLFGLVTYKYKLFGDGHLV